jgi:TatD DNase family protein
MKTGCHLPYFDAHSHVHLGLQHSPPVPPAALWMPSLRNTDGLDDNGDVPVNIVSDGDALSGGARSDHEHTGSNRSPRSMPIHIQGMALMSTHPRDYNAVVDTLTELRSSSPTKLLSNDSNPTTNTNSRVFYGVPCFGVHPWFLHEVPTLLQNDWLDELEHKLRQYPQSVVGEIGLDGYHYDFDTRELTSPMEQQVAAFEAQLRLAHKLQRPVSMHAVQCWQPIMTTLSRFAKAKQLPPKLYFHAFGAKLGFTDQLLSLVEKSKQHDSVEIFFGFAPVVNFRSPAKTREVMQRVGLHRIVLESDHEDSSLVAGSLQAGAQFIAEALGESVEAVVQTTWENSRRLYSIDNASR